jgi:hypothetical protein
VDAILVAIGGLPQWVIFGIVGGIFGGAAGVLAWVIERGTGQKLGRFLPVLAIAATPTLTRQVVLPAINEANEPQLPHQVDEVTMLVRMEVVDRRQYYFYELADVVPADFDVQAIKTEGLANICDFWRGSFAKGSVVEAVYSYKLHGRVRAFTVAPSDC